MVMYLERRKMHIDILERNERENSAKKLCFQLWFHQQNLHFSVLSILLSFLSSTSSSPPALDLQWLRSYLLLKNAVNLFFLGSYCEN